MQYPEDFMNKIINMDCLEGMKHIPDKSIDLVVTSPPYDGLRDYNGNNKQWGEHVWKKIVKDLFRVIKSGGCVVWIVADATINGSESGSSFKQALYFKEIGFNLHDTMIWRKESFSNPFPNRYHQIFEYMFIFSKDNPKTFNGIFDRKNKHYGAIISPTVREADASLHKRKPKIINEYGKRHNVWDIFVNKNNRSIHPATFPEQLAKDHIISWSNKGDTILDPFMGSGTTAKACQELGRNYIGFELEKKYCQIAEQRLAEQPLLVV